LCVTKTKRQFYFRETSMQSVNAKKLSVSLCPPQEIVWHAALSGEAGDK
jgi:hypothetical protein